MRSSIDSIGEIARLGGDGDRALHSSSLPTSPYVSIPLRGERFKRIITYLQLPAGLMMFQSPLGEKGLKVNGQLIEVGYAAGCFNPR